jgi:hypothetical protein
LVVQKVWKAIPVLRVQVAERRKEAMSDQLHEAVSKLVELWPHDTTKVKEDGRSWQKHVPNYCRRCQVEAALLAAHPATKSEQEVLGQPSLAPDKTAELTRKQGHSALRWNKGEQKLETFDPHPAEPSADAQIPSQVGDKILIRHGGRCWLAQVLSELDSLAAARTASTEGKVK